MANILIIDDDEDITRFLQSQLSEEGHAVTVVHQGEEGMAKALKAAPDLIMLDVFLPDATGFQMCNQFRKNERTRSIPIIMMTGAARFPNQKIFGLERGANEYIPKPFNLLEVEELIHKYIGPKQSSSDASKTNHGTAPLEPAAKVKQPAAFDDRETLGSFLEQSLLKKKITSEMPVDTSESTVRTRPLETSGNGDGLLQISLTVPQEPPTLATHASHAPLGGPACPVGRPAKEDIQRPEVNVQPARDGEFIPAILASQDRFVEFSLDMVALASRLCSTHAETYLADQLLRCSLSVGARIYESRSADSQANFLAMLQIALKDLREAGYWLMLVRRTGLLEKLCKTDLEKSCQSLTTLLTDFVNTEKKHA